TKSASAAPGRSPVAARPYRFFFQAEDGIRDFHVTGVQTCALPISHPRIPERAIDGASAWRSSLEKGICKRYRLQRFGDDVWGRRSEERRVGKEGSCGVARVLYEQTEDVAGRSAM